MNRTSLFFLSLSTTVGLTALANTKDLSRVPTVPLNTGICHGSIQDDLNWDVATVMKENTIPGLTVAVSKNGRMICHKGFGYANWDTKRPMQPYSVSEIGSTSKVPLASAMMKLVEEKRNDINLQTLIYGNQGILKDADFEDAMRQGTRRHRPIIGMGIGQNNRVFTWFRDGD